MLLATPGCDLDSDLSDRVARLEFEVKQLQAINAQQQAELEVLRSESEDLRDELERQVRLRHTPIRSRTTTPSRSTSRCAELGDGHYVLDLTTLEPEDISREVRVIPHLTDGQTDGYKLYAIHYDSLLASCGLRNGDLVRSVSDTPLTSTDLAMQAYEHARTADSLVIGLDRRGTPKELRIDLSRD